MCPVGWKLLDRWGGYRYGYIGYTGYIGYMMYKYRVSIKNKDTRYTIIEFIPHGECC